MCYQVTRSKRSYPGKSRPTRGKPLQVKITKPQRRAPGTGLGYDDDVMRQMNGDYKKPSLRRGPEPSPMRVLTTVLG